MGRVERARPAAPRTVDSAGFARWLACAAALHAGVLLVAALAGGVSAASTPSRPARSLRAQTSLDIVVDPLPAHVAPSSDASPPPPREPSPSAVAHNPPVRAARPEREAPVSSSTPRPADADPKPAPHGLGTVSDGNGVWPTNIPHHLGKITGSRHGGVAVWGEMPEVGIRRSVGEHSPSILRCYREGLSSAPNIAGRAIMRFVIERDGHVQRVNTLGSDFPSKSVLRCLERLFREIRFPEPDSGTVTVTYPLPLSSAQEPNWETVP